MSVCKWPEHHEVVKRGGVVALAVAVVVVWRFGRIIETITLTAVYVAAGLLTARLVYAVVRFTDLPAAARRNYPAAVWARLRWRYLVRNLGLSLVDAHAKDGGQRKVRHPRARIRPDAYGWTAWVKTVPGADRQAFEDVAGHIANAHRAARVSVSQPEPGRLIVRSMRRDPLLELLPMDHAPAGVYGSTSVQVAIGFPIGWKMDRAVQAPVRLYLGRDEHGNDRFADLANVPGIVVGGMPGSGKSTEITAWLTQLAPSPAVQFALLDGKGAGEFDDFAPRAYAMAGDDLDEALEVLETQHAIMTDRLASVRSVLWVKNAWHVGPTVDWPLVVTILDECQSYLDLTAVKGDKDLEAKVRRAIFLVSSLVRRGRSVMMLTIPATQKPTTDSLPSGIRENCPLSLAFGLRTTDGAVATLGSAIRDYPSYSPVTLADGAYAGCCTATLKTGQDPFTRLRGPWVTEDQAAEVAQASAHLRRDPAQLLPVVVPDDASSLVGAGEGL